MTDSKTIYWVLSSESRNSFIHLPSIDYVCRRANTPVEFAFPEHPDEALKHLINVQYPLILLDIIIGNEFSSPNSNFLKYTENMVQRLRTSDSLNKKTPIIVTGIYSGKNYPEIGNVEKIFKDCGATAYYNMEGSLDSFANLVLEHLK